MTVIGDSTLIGADGSTGLIGEADSITTRLAEIGVVDLRLEVGGGRSVVERLGQQENGEEVAARTRATGFAGCWVVALGTNDAANIAAGSQADAEDRVGRILDATEAGPILWLDASTITDETFWARANTQSWNSALEVAVGALDDGGRIDVAEWDAVAASQPWFVADGIHHNAAGLAARVAFIADELLATYPER